LPVLQPLKSAGFDSGFFDAILVGFALHFAEISVDVTAVIGGVPKLGQSFGTPP